MVASNDSLNILFDLLSNDASSLNKVFIEMEVKLKDRYISYQVFAV